MTSNNVTGQLSYTQMLEMVSSLFCAIFGGRIMSGSESMEGNWSQEVKKSNMERWSVDLNNKKDILIL